MAAPPVVTNVADQQQQAKPLVPPDSMDPDEFEALPTTKLYRLTKCLATRNIACAHALDVKFPEFFHTLNLEHFDIDTLQAMFSDEVLKAGDNFIYHLNRSFLSFRLTRGPGDAILPNYGTILGVIRLVSVIGREKVSFLRNDAISNADVNVDWEYEDVPLTLQAAFSMAAEIKEDYLKTYPNQDYSDAVMEFSTKRATGLFIKYKNPIVVTTPAPPPSQLAVLPQLPVIPLPPNPLVPMQVDSNTTAAPKGNKRPRSSTDVSAATTLVVNLAAPVLARKRVPVQPKNM
ncbi:MAG: hypothetical protein HC888_02290 [Candidatus Competibacteraceae bacterium]|nr:hypothetical protein [Candidatus Competibacteraceae bacterium]